MMSVENLENSELAELSLVRADGVNHLTWQCDVCGVTMLDLHCKLRCVNCGFMRDCSDP